MKPRILYIASPYTSGDTAQNVRNAYLMAEKVRAKGWLPFCPLSSHFWNMISPHPRSYWMQMDLEWVQLCDAVLRIKGSSPGADEEAAMAIGLGKPVYRSFSEVPELSCPLRDKELVS